MAGNNMENSSSTTDAAQPAARDFNESDWLLRHFVSLVNNTNSFEMGVTLLVDGFLVSGLLCSGKAFLEGIGNSLKDGVEHSNLAGQGLGETFRDGMTKFAERMYGVRSDSVPVYIHLRDARFFNTSGVPLPNDAGVWWRGRLSLVSGFNLGTLSQSSA
jgi:hypothetical protein